MNDTDDLQTCRLFFEDKFISNNRTYTQNITKLRNNFEKLDCVFKTMLIQGCLIVYSKQQLSSEELIKKSTKICPDINLQFKSMYSQGQTFVYQFYVR